MMIIKKTVQEIGCGTSGTDSPLAGLEMRLRVRVNPTASGVTRRKEAGGAAPLLGCGQGQT